uniref:Uncharacterized protein n=1 Tax=Tanacetum cinerariifolium TaxID=118510 RepID=A0A6L2JWY0_TANCI|nr:hypothetical protein [Tanacetum cinerariifolium]
MSYVSFLPPFVELKKNDRRVVEGRKKSTISRLLLDKTYNNDKNLSEVQLEHEKEDEFVVVVKETHRGRGGKSFWEGGNNFRVYILRFHTYLTDIIGFLEKLEWCFEQDIDKEEERFEEMQMVVKYESWVIK